MTIFRGWRDAGSDIAARASLERALGLWRGPLLGGVLAGSANRDIGLGLDETRLTAAEDLYEIATAGSATTTKSSTR